VIATTNFAAFGIVHVRAFVAHGQSDCVVAAAQSWDDGKIGGGPRQVGSATQHCRYVGRRTDV
jgi:hypothetical protein